MRFLLDMNLPPALAEWLREEGHDAVHVGEAGLGDSSDSAIFAHAAVDRRVVVTFDLDFGELAVPGRRHAGVILFRLRTARRDYLRERLRVVITQAGPAIESGAIALVEDSRIRIRRLTDQGGA
jgi:predicted nuclease of predicted toxin-antitoxin system